MAKNNTKSIGMAVLGIVLVVALLGLVLLLKGSPTGKAGVEQAYAASLGGKNVNKVQCPVQCGSSRGAKEEAIMCVVDESLQGKKVYNKWDSCPGTDEMNKKCFCPVEGGF